MDDCEVDKVFHELSKQRVKKEYIQEFGPLEYKTVTVGKEGDFVGRLEFSFPTRLFLAGEEDAEYMMTVMKDVLGLMVGSEEFANMVVPALQQMLMFWGTQILHMAQEAREEARLEDEDDEPDDGRWN